MMMKPWQDVKLQTQQQAAAGSRQRLAQTARSALKDNVAVTYGPVAHSNQTFMEMRRCHRHFFSNHRSR